MATLRPEDLPAWMRPRSHIVDHGWLIVLGFSLLLVLPLLTHPGLPAGSDANLYAYRSLEVKQLLQSGTLYSRWSPDFNYTYGSPLFNYLAPLPHYLAGLHQDITESDPISSIRLLIGFSILAASSGMYFFVHARWGSHAALIASLVYAYSPPLALSLPYESSDLGPLLALAILPWVLWALDRLWQVPNRTNLWLAALLFSAFILSDDRIVLLGLPIILLAMIALKRRTWPQRRAYRYVLTAMLSAVLLCAFFWLPALAERDSTHWLPLKPDPRSGAVPLGEILATTTNPDPTNLLVQRNIGVGTWLLALTGVVGMIVQIRRGNRSSGVLSFLIPGLIFLIAATPIFGGLWISSFQNPWPYHALLLSLFCLAVVAGQSAHLLNRLSPRLQLAGLILLMMIAPILALPSISSLQWQPQTTPFSDVTLSQSELQRKHFGSLRDGVLLPAAVSQLPDPPPDLVDQSNFNTVQRVKPIQYTAHIGSLEQGLLRSHYVIDASQPVVIEFNILYYPGWTLSLNGQSRTIDASNAGLITLSVPQGTNDVIVSFEGTPIRNLGWGIMMVGLLVLLVANHRLRRSITQNSFASDGTLNFAHRELILLSVTLVLYAVVVLIVFAKPELLSVFS